MQNLQRPLIAQQFTTTALAVTAAPLPLQANVNLQALIDTFGITVPSTAANSIFFGSPGVSVGAGFEIIAGTTVFFRIDHDGRQLYELQTPALDIDMFLQCKSISPEVIPFVVWDLSQCFVVAAAPTTCSLITFRAMFI